MTVKFENARVVGNYNPYRKETEIQIFDNNDNLLHSGSEPGELSISDLRVYAEIRFPQK